MPSCYWSVSLPLYQVEEHRRLTWVRRLEDGGRRGVSVPSSATVADPCSQLADQSCRICWLTEVLPRLSRLALWDKSIEIPLVLDADTFHATAFCGISVSGKGFLFLITTDKTVRPEGDLRIRRYQSCRCDCS